MRTDDLNSFTASAWKGRLTSDLLVNEMANYNKYDSRVDALVIETKTLWDPEIGELSGEDKSWLSQAVHQQPEKASKIQYERAHTGFTRTITVSVADIERLYEERVGG
jgi:hypothetical protein